MNKKTLQHNNPAKDFFLYLTLFFSLAFVAFGEGSILFQLVNKFINDPIEKVTSPFHQGAVKFGIASLIIAGPIFFVVSRIIFRRVLEKKTPLNSSVRKWLTYIVIFLTSATIIVGLIALIMRFLNGDAPQGFLAKMLVILMISGSILGYYFWNMLRANNDKNKIRKKRMIAYSCAGVMALTLIFAFFVIDSPSVSKQKRTDRQSILNIQNADLAIRGYYSQSSRLPNSLAELEKTEFYPKIQNGFGKVTYVVQGGDSYKLCANFVRSNKLDEEVVISADSWKHDAGRVCFDRIAIKNSK